MALILSIILFGGFVADVVMGALFDTRVLSDVQQMLLLFAASLAFVVVILQREARARGAMKNQTEQ